MKNVITSVGTSLFTNYMDKDIRRILDTTENIEEEFGYLKNKDSSEYLNNRYYIKKIKKVLTNNWIVGIHKIDNEWTVEKEISNCDASAEIKSLIKIQKECNTKINVELICTDTILSMLSAEIIKENINKINSNIIVENEIHVINGLQINDYRNFTQNGLQNLFRTLETLTYKDCDHDILNISGGYKAIIPYLTIYGQLYNIPINYIYEESDMLIKIGRLPIQFDMFFAERYYPYIMEPNIYGSKNKIVQELRDLLILVKDYKKFDRTFFGDMFLQYIDKQLLISKSVMGFFMEYKLYEYYLNNPYKDDKNEIYKYVYHSVKEEWMGKREIDLILSVDDKKYRNFIVQEIKSYLHVYKKGEALDKLKNQVEAQLEVLITNRKKPAEYHLCLYKSGDRRVNKDFKENINVIKDIVESKQVKFKAFLVNIDYGIIDDDENTRYFENNPYQKFMKNKLEKNDIEQVI